MAALIEANAAAAPSSLSGVSFVSWDQQLFDPIELQGDDLRDAKLVTRKQTLAKLLSRADDAIVYNEHLEDDGAMVFDHACRMGLEGIVSKGLAAPHRSGPSKVWLKSKTPLSEAVRREAEEDWG